MTKINVLDLAIYREDAQKHNEDRRNMTTKHFGSPVFLSWLGWLFFSGMRAGARLDFVGSCARGCETFVVMDAEGRTS